MEAQREFVFGLVGGMMFCPIVPVASRATGRAPGTSALPSCSCCRCSPRRQPHVGSDSLEAGPAHVVRGPVIVDRDIFRQVRACLLFHTVGAMPLRAWRGGIDGIGEKGT